MAERFLDFEIRRFKNYKKIRKTKVVRKVHRPGSMCGQSWAENKNFESNLLAHEAKQLDENKQMALDCRNFSVCSTNK